jgi:hypothetical protein
VIVVVAAVVVDDDDCDPCSLEVDKICTLETMLIIYMLE